MWRAMFRSLRVRMAVLLATAVLMTVAAALALIWTFVAADKHVQGLTSAQHRLELLSGLSGRVGDFALIALQTTESAGQPDRLSLPRKRVQEVFARLDEEIAGEVARLGSEEGRTLIAARSRVLAHMRGRFEFLDRQALQAVRDARAGHAGNVDRLRSALDSFANGFGPSLSQAIAEERAAANAAEAAMSELRARLMPGAVIAIVAALLIAAGVYRAIALPLVTRISEVAKGVGDIGQGRTDIRLVVRGRDELSVAMMRFNRMAAHLSRREAQLLADQSRLQETIDARTAELRAANERLSDIDRARRRFFTDVSHELRTPLTVILGEVDVTLRAKTIEIEDLKSALSTIRARARALHRRVEDLLRVARSESGQLELELEPIAVADLLAEARDGMAAAARARGVALLAEAPGLDHLVEADGDWLRQVLEALIANALRHSSAGASVRLNGWVDGAQAVIAVVDDGDGIPETETAHVFERFYRGSGVREGSGFGIGLALARWVVERHGGAISLQSRTVAANDGPSGTTVTIRLPLLSHRFAVGAG